MTVWTVWSGSYSDRGMAGVFSTKEKAEAYIQVAKHIYFELDDEPIEYVLDEQLGEKERYCVRLEKGSGNIMNPEWFVCDCGVDVEEQDDCYEVFVNFQYDYDRMVKAARDKLAEYKAREAGI